tara:strand:- start:272 stop:1183 length:912 start_codon:yes stop_codon:yes gene_type:complete
MGNEQSSNQQGSMIILGETPFCATAAVGTSIHALSPSEIKKPEPESTSKPPPPSTNQFKKPSMFSKTLSLAKKGAKLAHKGAKQGIKLAMGATLRPKLIPGQLATRTCFMCFAGVDEHAAGQPVLYGVDVYLRGNVNDGAVLRKDGNEGRLKFKGTDLEGACAIRILSATGKETGQPVLLGEQFILTIDQGAQVFVFVGAEDGGIVLESRAIQDVPANENAVFKAATIPAKLQKPVEEEGGGGDSAMFIGLLGAMLGSGAMAASSGSVSGTIKNVRNMERMASAVRNPAAAAQQHAMRSAMKR